MSDDDKKPARKPLTLKGAQPGEVKQTFSHGRTNKVAVEVKRRRKLVKPGETPPAPPPPPPAPEPAPAPAPTPTAAKPEVKKKPAPSNETPQERVARLQREAEEARVREEREAKQAVEDEKKRASARKSRPGRQ